MFSSAAARGRKRQRLRQTNSEDFQGLDLDALEDEDKGGDEGAEKRAVRALDHSKLAHPLPDLRS